VSVGGVSTTRHDRGDALERKTGLTVPDALLARADEVIE
jgi:hypothetical protein